MKTLLETVYHTRINSVYSSRIEMEKMLKDLTVDLEVVEQTKEMLTKMISERVEQEAKGLKFTND